MLSQVLRPTKRPRLEVHPSSSPAPSQVQLQEGGLQLIDRTLSEVLGKLVPAQDFYARLLRSTHSPILAFCAAGPPVYADVREYRAAPRKTMSCSD